jgi:hypothetical protein
MLYVLFRNGFGMVNAHGITPLIILWLTPGWANGGRGERVKPTNPGDYARVGRRAENRYAGKVSAWELWNEPNSNDFFIGADPPCRHTAACPPQGG